MTTAAPPRLAARPPRRTSRRAAWAVAAAVVVGSASPAAAQPEEEVYLDARYEGYPSPVALDGSSAAFSYVLLAGLGVLAVGVLLKDAKRSHLD